MYIHVYKEETKNWMKKPNLNENKFKIGKKFILHLKCGYRYILFYCNILCSELSFTSPPAQQVTVPSHIIPYQSVPPSLSKFPITDHQTDSPTLAPNCHVQSIPFPSLVSSTTPCNLPIITSKPTPNKPH